MAWPLIIDDDGTGMTGTPTNNALFAEIKAYIDAAGAGVGVSSVPTVGAIPALPLPAGSGPLVIYLTNPTLATIQGIAPGVSGQHLTLISAGAGQADLHHQNGSAAAAARLINAATVGATPLAAGSGRSRYVYDATPAVQRWRLIEHQQGAWITSPFAAGDFTGLGGMTWTVDAADRVRLAWRLDDRKVTVTANIVSTTVGGTPGQQLLIGNGQWGGFSAVGVARGSYWYQDNAVVGHGFVSTAGAQLGCFLSALGNWAAATNTTFVEFTFTFEVA